MEKKNVVQPTKSLCKKIMTLTQLTAKLLPYQPYIILAGALFLIYHVMITHAGTSTALPQGYGPYLPVAPLGADPGTFGDFVGGYDYEPVSRPTSTHSSLGGGKGGPLVGSQMTKLGGSEFLPGRRLYPDNYGYGPGQFGSRGSTAFVRPSPPTSVPVTEVLPTPQPISPTPQSLPTAPRPSALAPSMVAPVAPAAPAPLPLAPADSPILLPLAPADSPDVVPITPPAGQLGTIYINSRDGYIVQPRR